MRVMRPIVACVVLALGIVVEANAGILLTRNDLDTSLGAAASTEDFESWTGSALTAPDFDTLDSSTILGGQGPGIVNDGLLFTADPGPAGFSFLQLDRSGFYNVPSGSLLAVGQGLIIDFQDFVTDAGFDFFEFDGSADTATITVFGADDTTLLYTSGLLSAPNAPASNFFGYQDLSGIGKIEISSTNRPFSPLIDNLTYGSTVAPVPEPSTMALIAIGAGLAGVNALRRRRGARHAETTA